MLRFIPILIFHYFIKNITADPIPFNGNRTQKVHIAIYYESLCPDSMDFITNQFQTAYEQFKDHIDILFVPFGKSESENNGEAFYCQHGPAECSGNRIQSCVLDNLQNDQDAKVKFVTCQMNWNADYTGKQCANSVNVTHSELLNCTLGVKGVELQLNDELETHLIAKPYPKFIPTIVFNKVYDSNKQWRSLREFRKVLCEELIPILSVGELPMQC